MATFQHAMLTIDDGHALEWHQMGGTQEDSNQMFGVGAFDDAVTRAGSLGWEMVAVDHEPGLHYYWFKRQVD